MDPNLVGIVPRFLSSVWVVGAYGKEGKKWNHTLLYNGLEPDPTEP